MSMMERRGVVRWLALSLMVLPLASCSQLIVKSDFDPEADFTHYATYRWFQPPKPHARSIESAALFDISIRKAVDEELSARGFREADGSKPDFGVSYHVGVQEKVDVSTTEYRSWRGRLVDQRVNVHPYKEGTVVLNLIDADTKQLAWRGWATGIVDNPGRVRENIGAIVQQILAKFPPEEAKPTRTF